MEFVLSEYHRNIDKEDIKKDLLRVAQQLQTETLTQKQYSNIGRYSPDTIARAFDGWSKALEESGLIAKKKSTKIRYKFPSKEELIEDIKNVSEKLGVDTLTSSEYALYGRFNRNSFTRVFGSWREALVQAGLRDTGYHRNITEEELMTNIENLWIMLGRQPTCQDIASEMSRYGIKPYYTRYGSWTNALKRFIVYINKSDEDISGQTLKNNEMNHLTRSKVANTHNTKRNINLRLRFKVMQRDNFRCCICGASPAKTPEVELHIDHIIPWSKGGETTFENLQTLCSKCNLGKSDLI